MLPGERIKFIDLHTHRRYGSAETLTVRNIKPGEAMTDAAQENRYYSTGIHPWDLKAETLERDLRLVMEMASHSNVLMIGESGYDKLRGPGEGLQKRAFQLQAEIAGEYGKPVIIHCVKGWNFITETYKRMKPAQKWIIHGYRGSAQLASELTDRGFGLSLGKEGLKNEVLIKVLIKEPKKTLIENLFFETDASGDSVEEVYSLFSEMTGIPVGEAAQQIRSNFIKLFS